MGHLLYCILYFRWAKNMRERVTIGKLSQVSHDSHLSHELETTIVNVVELGFSESMTLHLTS